MSSSKAATNGRNNKTSSKPLVTPPNKPNDPKEAAPAKPFSLPKDKNLLTIDSKDDFENIIKEAGERLIMFEFFAPWCGPCRILTTKLVDMANLYRDKLLIVKIDVDEFEDLAIEHNVTAMPTFLIMQNKKLLQQFSSSNAEHLQETVEKYAGKPEQEEDKGKKSEGKEGEKKDEKKK
ncbi:thioredoxin-2-like [Musca domestica]|uniref:Thioredoxin-2-like n=1 Tax=Musca domestica TaxID=7370 RepID=A0A9J7DGJ2_MUSDO|nr:thioredoxin-2-like [Musca domestica]